MTGPAVTGRASATHLMAVCNVTPDSFSDGGRFEGARTIEERTQFALDYALGLVDAGATIIDVGGESTRPGAKRVPQVEEAERVVPLVAALAERGVAVSVDTMNAATAAASLEAGAAYINDVSGGQADPDMLPLMAATGAPFILSHWRGHSVIMNSLADYTDPARDILRELLGARDTAIAAGLTPEHIILDPGLGFAKDAQHNWAVLGHLDEFTSAGHPLLIGASRKRFTGELLAEGAPVEDRDLPTALITALCAVHGVWGVRVHNVPMNRTALDVASAWRGGMR